MSIKREPFHKQFVVCNGDGTCQHMSRTNHDLMSESEQKRYGDEKSKMGLVDNYFGPRGPLFCGASPGICSSDHCPKLKEAR